MSFPTGMAELIDALLARLGALGVDLRADRAVSAIRPVDGGYEVVLDDGGPPGRRRRARHPGAGVGPVAAGPVPGGGDAAGGDPARLDRHRVAGLPDRRRRPPARPATASSCPGPKGATCWPAPGDRASGRAAPRPGRCSSGVTSAASGRESVLEADDDGLVHLVRAELGALAGIRGTPVHTEVHRYPAGMPQYTVGHLGRVERIRAALAAVPRAGRDRRRLRRRRDPRLHHRRPHHRPGRPGRSRPVVGFGQPFSMPPRRPRPSSLLEFLRTEAGGGVVLLVAALAAVVWANSPWKDGYHDFWHHELAVGPAGWALRETLQHWVNDGLMALFFFVVGLEIKRELVVRRAPGASGRRPSGDRRRRRDGAARPPVPRGGRPGEAAGGWGIPMATDIAFAVGVLAVLGARGAPGAQGLRPDPGHRRRHRGHRGDRRLLRRWRGPVGSWLPRPGWPWW